MDELYERDARARLKRDIDSSNRRSVYGGLFSATSLGLSFIRSEKLPMVAKQALVVVAMGGAGFVALNESYQSMLRMQLYASRIRRPQQM